MLTGFQFRAALVATRQMDQEVAKNTSLTPATILRLKKTTNFEDLQCNNSTIKLLNYYFNSIGIFFPRENTIEYNIVNPLVQQNSELYLTRFQLAIARDFANLTQEQLGPKIGISGKTIGRLEALQNHEYLQCRTLNAAFAKAFFEKLGVVFEATNIISVKKI